MTQFFIQILVYDNRGKNATFQVQEAFLAKVVEKVNNPYFEGEILIRVYL